MIENFLAKVKFSAQKRVKLTSWAAFLLKGENTHRLVLPYIIYRCNEMLICIFSHWNGVKIHICSTFGWKCPIPVQWRGWHIRLRSSFGRLHSNLLHPRFTKHSVIAVNLWSKEGFPVGGSIFCPIFLFCSFHSLLPSLSSVSSGTQVLNPILYLLFTDTILPSHVYCQGHSFVCESVAGVHVQKKK